MNTSALSDATLDCWVERAEILRLNPNASVAHPVHCQKFTLNPDIAAPIIKRERIVVSGIPVDPRFGRPRLPVTQLRAALGAARVNPRASNADPAPGGKLCYGT